MRQCAQRYREMTVATYVIRVSSRVEQSVCAVIVSSDCGHRKCGIPVVAFMQYSWMCLFIAFIVTGSVRRELRRVMGQKDVQAWFLACASGFEQR